MEEASGLLGMWSTGMLLDLRSSEARSMQSRVG